MASQNVTNLDYLAATRAQKIIKRTSEKASARDVDNTVTKALGVLQENGVYACFLYLLAKEKDIGKIVVEEMLDVLQNLGWNKPSSLTPEVVLGHISDNITRDLERLLLAKEVLEQTLIYARYGAKARDASES